MPQQRQTKKRASERHGSTRNRQVASPGVRWRLEQIRAPGNQNVGMLSFIGAERQQRVQREPATEEETAADLKENATGAVGWHRKRPKPRFP